jgi:hypothetical protein
VRVALRMYKQNVMQKDKFKAKVVILYAESDNLKY